MALIRRGKQKGQSVEISQFCNNWFMLEDGSIVSPLSLQFTLKEMERIEKHRKEGGTGVMFEEFQWDFPFIKRRARG